jgi:hypothetical protein
MKIGYILALFYCGMLLANEKLADLRKSVVQIYAKKGGFEALGTGFWVSGDGEIVTAYHVVHEARQIEVFDSNNKRYESVLIEHIDQLKDLALLKIVDVDTPSFLKVKSSPPATSQELTVIGFPLGNREQTVTARVSSRGIFESTSLTSDDGKKIFEKKFNVFMMDITAYKGMSGAPVVDADGYALGLFQGSLNQGGALGWVISGEHVESLLKENRMRRSLSKIDWPPILGDEKFLKSLVRKDKEKETKTKQNRGLASSSAMGFTFIVTSCQLSNGNLTCEVEIQGGRVNQGILLAARSASVGIRNMRIGLTSIVDDTSSTYGATLIEIANNNSARDSQGYARVMIMAGEKAVAKLHFQNVPSDMKYLAGLTLCGGTGNVSPYSIDTVPFCIPFRHIPVQQ